MNCSRLSRLLWSLLPCLVAAGAASAAPAAAETGAVAAPPAPIVWEAQMKDFSDATYAAAVERLFADFEATNGANSLRPGPRGSVGLKIYTDSGAGLNTPTALVHAVIDALVRRGFAPQKIFLVGLNQGRLRETGYLPALSKGGSSFAEHPVFVLESGRFYDAQWFYDSPLPARFAPGVLEQQAAPENEAGSGSADRKSFLATPLFLDADFWINLPVYSDHPVLGINGALVKCHALECQQHRPVPPEPRQRSGRRGRDGCDPGAARDLALHHREPGVLPVHRRAALSFALHHLRAEALAQRRSGAPRPLMLERFNVARKHDGFLPLMGEDRRLLEYSEKLGLGTAQPKAVQWRRP
jgi:hypothetical protein